MPTLNLFINTQTGQLVKGFRDPAPVTIPKIIQGDTLSISITLLEWSELGLFSGTPFTKVAVSGLSYRVGIYDQDSDPSASTPPIYQNSWTLDTTNNKATGVLSIGASDVQTMLGSALEVEKKLSISVDGTTERHSWSYPVTLRAHVIPNATTPPTPADEYLTKNQSDGRYLRTENKGFILVSPDGSQKRFMWLTNDGEVRTDKMT